MVNVVAPHWSEHIWLEVLKKPETVQNALFPDAPETKPHLTAAREYVRNTSSSITSAEGAQMKRMMKGKNTVSFPLSNFTSIPSLPHTILPCSSCKVLPGHVCLPS